MQEEKKKSWAALLVEAVTSPGAAFKEIAERPGFWPAGITLTIINLAIAWLTLPKAQEYAQLTLEKLTDTMSAEQAEILAKTMGPQSVTVTTMVSALIMPWITWLVVALILKIFAAVTDKEAPFRKMFAVGVYSYVPALIGGLVGSILVMNTAAENMLKASPTLAVFSPAESGFLFSFLSACNPFTWWSLVLCGIGAAAVMKVKRPNGVLICLFIVWLAFALLTGAAGTLNTAGL
jgi:hypothetical protein